MKTLVTGGAGFIGRHLVDSLLRNGHEVVVLDSLTEQVHAHSVPTFRADVEFIRGDIRSESTVSRAVAKADNIVHLAAETGVGQSMYEVARYTDVNDYGTATLLQAVMDRTADLRRFVLASSRAVYGEGLYRCDRCGDVTARASARNRSSGWDPSCPFCGGPIRAQPTHEDVQPDPASVYAATKAQQERLLQLVGGTTGLSTIALRFFNVFGPGQALSNPYTGILSTFYARLSSGRPLQVYEDGRMLRDFVTVADVIVAIEAALDIGDHRRGHEVYNVASGTSTTILELATRLRGLMGSDSPIEITGAYRLGDVRHSVADTRRAHRELGFTAVTALDDGLRVWLDWARHHRIADRTDVARAVLEARGLYRVAVG
jgi:dTDP-L-rhamnose 4-epimerase